MFVFFSRLVAEITGHSLISGAGFIIALGVIIILLSVLGKKIQIKKINKFIKLRCFL